MPIELCRSGQVILEGGASSKLGANYGHWPALKCILDLYLQAEGAIFLYVFSFFRQGKHNKGSASIMPTSLALSDDTSSRQPQMHLMPELINVHATLHISPELTPLHTTRQIDLGDDHSTCLCLDYVSCATQCQHRCAAATTCGSLPGVAL